jgi:hypothetical protein
MTPTQLKTWTIISGTGAAGSGGGTGGTSSPYVNIDSASEFQRDNGQYEIDLYWSPSSLATPANFSGVVAYIEDPDISSDTRGHGPIGAGIKLDSTAQTSGAWTPVQVTKSTQSPVAILVTEQAGPRNVRIYLASYGPNITDTLIRANDHVHNPTPSVVINVPALTREYQSGEEYAWLVSNVKVTVLPDYTNPTPTYQLQFFYTPPDPTLPLPPGMNPFAGCRIFYAYLDAAGNPAYPATDSGIDVPVAAAQGLVKSPAYDVGAGGSFWVYFCSEDNSSPLGNHINTLVPGVTPYYPVSILPPGATGDTNLDVTNLQIVNTSFEQQPDGSMWALLTLSWNNPATNLYAGVEFYHVSTDGTSLGHSVAIGNINGGGVKQVTLAVSNYPNDAIHTWRIYGISYLSMGKANDDVNAPTHSPYVDWKIGPPAALGVGVEWAPLVTLTHPSATSPIQMATGFITYDQQTSSDGVMMMRFNIGTPTTPSNPGNPAWNNPVDNKFGGVKVAMVTSDGGIHFYDADKQTYLQTPWQPALTNQTITFYLVSYNPQGQLNTIVPGVTPFGSTQFIPKPGQVQATLLPTNWFDTTNFAWPNANQGGLFTANIIQSNKLYVGSILRVGGAPAGSIATNGQPASSSFSGGSSPNNIGQANGQIAVYSSGVDPGDNGTPQLRAWMGQQTNVVSPDGTTATVNGGWFYQLYVGGHDPRTSPLYVNNSGIVQVGGWDVQTQLGVSWYPWISVRDKTNTEVARIGARINLTPSAPNGIVPIGDVADIGGAWFEEIAIGGVNLADWRILWGTDNTLRMRNVNQFVLNYPQNFNPLGKQFNAPYQLQYGTCIAWQSMGTTNYAFPGMTLMRLDPVSQQSVNHGITIVNRGIILNTPELPPPQNAAALVTYNDDANGGDGPDFYSVLTMASFQSKQTNVLLASGANDGSVTAGASRFRLGDGAGNQTFSVDPYGSIRFRSQLFWIGAGSDQSMISVNGNWNWGTFESGIGISVRNYGQVIDANGNWTGRPISGGGAGAGQTPWTQNINAQNFTLYNVGPIQSFNYYNFNQGWALYDSPAAGLGTLNIFAGQGILQSGAGDSPPASLWQVANFVMMDSGRTTRINLQSNYPETTANAPALILAAANSNPRIQLRSGFYDGASGQALPIIGVGFTDTYNGYIDISNYQITGYATGGTKTFMLENSNGVAGALHLYTASSGSPYFTLSAGFLYSAGGAFPTTANGFLIFQDQNGAYRSIPYF